MTACSRKHLGSLAAPRGTPVPAPLMQLKTVFVAAVVALLMAATARASEADLAIPDLTQGHFILFGKSVSAWDILAGGAFIILITLGFSLYLRMQIHRLPAHPNGDVWLNIVTVIEDPRYLNGAFYTSTNFRLEPDGSKFNPTPCRTDPPLPVTGSK